MNRIRVLNGNELLVKELGSVNENYDSLFIDWIPTYSNNPQKAESLLNQTNILEQTTKKNIKILIFDRYLSLTPKEISWLQKHKNIILCEPALITRAGFTYLPFWVKTRGLMEIPINQSNRQLHLLYYGKMSSRIKGFDNYYVWSKMWLPDVEVAYNTKDIDKSKEDELASKGIEKTNYTYSDAQYMIAIGTDKEYKVGYLDPYIFKALESNCVPIMPDEHRFYKAFMGFNDFKNWCTKLYEHVYIGFIHDFYFSIDKYYPEMKINSVKDQVYNLLK